MNEPTLRTRTEQTGQTTTFRRRTRRPVRTTSTLTDDSVIDLTLAGTGDEAAFGRIYDQFSSLVYGIVLRVLRDPAMSEEVAQEIFLELWRLAPRFDSANGSPKSWIATMAHRRAVDRVRSEQSRRQRDDRDAQLQPTEGVDVHEMVADQLDRVRVQKCLAELSSVQRESVTLAYFGGFTYREVASILDVAEGTIKTRIRDGLTKLREKLDDTE